MRIRKATPTRMGRLRHFPGKSYGHSRCEGPAVEGKHVVATLLADLELSTFIVLDQPPGEPAAPSHPAGRDGLVVLL